MRARGWGGTGGPLRRTSSPGTADSAGEGAGGRGLPATSSASQAAVLWMGPPARFGRPLHPHAPRRKKPATARPLEAKSNNSSRVPSSYQRPSFLPLWTLAGPAQCPEPKPGHFCQMPGAGSGLTAPPH